MDPLYAFVFAGLFSPGPNVILLTASGARFGFRATLPHVVGVALGVGVIAALMGLGVGALLLAQPGLALVLKIIAAGWILWMAYSLVRASDLSAGKAGEKPFTLLQAVLFQWVNPKVWAVAMAAAAGYGLGQSPWAEAQRLATASVSAPRAKHSASPPHFPASTSSSACSGASQARFWRSC